MKRVQHPTPESFYKALMASRSGGHECMLAREPKMRCLGYMDHTTEEHHLLPAGLLSSEMMMDLPSDARRLLGTDTGLRALLEG